VAPRSLFTPWGDQITTSGGAAWTPKWREWVRTVSDLLTRISVSGTTYGIVVTDSGGVAQAVVGEMDAVPFVAGDFTADAGTWTVEEADCAYAFFRIGRMVTLGIELVDTTVAGGPSELRILLPEGFIAARVMTTPVLVHDNGTPAMGLATTTDGGTQLLITRLDGAAFAAATDATDVRGTVTIEVDPF
jgi:hypothetical protein